MTAEAPSNEVWTIRRVLAWSADDLKKRSFSSPRLDVELLLGRVVGLDRVHLVIDADRPVSKEELATFRALFTRRRAGEPVAYLLGEREFYGRKFKVDRRVLIPRPDTETLVEVGLERTRSLYLCARVLDLCTGSGCVAISLACERPTTRVVATDISRDALSLARENALRLGAVNVAFAEGDLFDAVRGARAFDLITANPPYIAASEVPSLAPDIRDFEPRVALSPGDDPLAIARRIVDAAPAFLNDGGTLAMEVGAGQAPDVAKLFEARGFSDVRSRKDYGGIERVVSGIKA